MLYLPSSKRNLLFEGSLMKLRHSARTDVGKTRDHNEDNFGVGEDAEAIERLGQLLIVCDGMGGHAAGEVASKIGVETILQTYYDDSSEDRAAVLEQVFERANAAIYEKGRGSMGTTGVAALLHHDALHIANVGDSRAYLIRDGTMRQVSRDHSFVSDQVAAGLITAEQARSSPHRNVITRALGHQAGVTVDMFRLPLQIDDIVVLCSDGLHGLVNDPEIARIASDEPPEEAVKQLINLANLRGGHDNITVVIAHVEALDWDAQPIIDEDPVARHERVTVELPVSADGEEEAVAKSPAATPPPAVSVPPPPAGVTAVHSALPPRPASAPPPAPAARPAPQPRRLTLLGALLAALLLTVLIFVILIALNQPPATDPAVTPAPTAQSPATSPPAPTAQPTRTLQPTLAATSAAQPTAAGAPTSSLATSTSQPTSSLATPISQPTSSQATSAARTTTVAPPASQPVIAASAVATVSRSPGPTRPAAPPTTRPTLRPPPPTRDTLPPPPGETTVRPIP
jgi:serine/threonine protein phosphatase PrpC